MGLDEGSVVGRHGGVNALLVIYPCLAAYTRSSNVPDKITASMEVSVRKTRPNDGQRHNGPTKMVRVVSPDLPMVRVRSPDQN